jgi:hypothetical protein
MIIIAKHILAFLGTYYDTFYEKLNTFSSLPVVSRRAVEQDIGALHGDLLDIGHHKTECCRSE